MIPGARVAAAIELFEAVARGGGPAGRSVAARFSARRTAGSKDRRAMTDPSFAGPRSRADGFHLVVLERRGGS